MMLLLPGEKEKPLPHTLWNSQLSWQDCFSLARTMVEVHWGPAVLTHNIRQSRQPTGKSFGKAVQGQLIHLLLYSFGEIISRGLDKGLKWHNFLRSCYGYIQSRGKCTSNHSPCDNHLISLVLLVAYIPFYINSKNKQGVVQTHPQKTFARTIGHALHCTKSSQKLFLRCFSLPETFVRHLSNHHHQWEKAKYRQTHSCGSGGRAVILSLEDWWFNQLKCLWSKYWTQISMCEWLSHLMSRWHLKW